MTSVYKGLESRRRCALVHRRVYIIHGCGGRPEEG